MLVFFALFIFFRFFCLFFFFFFGLWCTSVTGTNGFKCKRIHICTVGETQMYLTWEVIVASALGDIRSGYENSCVIFITTYRLLGSCGM